MTGEATQDTAGPVLACDICGTGIYGSYRGHGDGSGHRFAHEECYWREQAEQARAERDRFETLWNESQDLLATAREGERLALVAIETYKDKLTEAEARAERAEAALERVLATVGKSVSGMSLGYGKAFDAAVARAANCKGSANDGKLDTSVSLPPGAKQSEGTSEYPGAGFAWPQGSEATPEGVGVCLSGSHPSRLHARSDGCLSFLEATPEGATASQAQEGEGS